MTRLCQLLDALAYVVVAVISLALNVLTGGSGREFFSKRAYRKAIFEGGRWRRIMGAVDWFFARLPSWTRFRSDHHCKDVYDRATSQAYAQIDEAARIREILAMRKGADTGR